MHAWKPAKQIGGLLCLLAAALVACQTPPLQVVEITRVVTQTVVEEGETVVVTRVISEISEVVASPTPPPPPLASVDPDPSTFIRLAAAGIQTLDPALAYDLPSTAALQNIVEGLIAISPRDANTLEPALATNVPSIDNGLVSEDGRTYTFPIRRGVQFHNGGTLDAHDVAYSIRRQLLQSDPTGPAWLFLEPILGLSDIAEDIAGGAFVGDADGLRANASPEELAAACERVLAAVTYEDVRFADQGPNDAPGTVTITLAQPWGPFLSTIPWLGVIDQEWAVANGAWDGSCDTWVDHYAPGFEASELNNIANGTGPYRLESWTPDEGYVLQAFDQYWRTAETRLGPAGPYGPARIKTVIVNLVADWGARLAALQVGDADYVDVPFDNESQVDALVGEFCDYLTRACESNPANPEGLLRKWDALPTVQRNDIFLNQAINPDSLYIGSGRLDGNGIPPDFFSDINIRRAMATCFDYDTFNADVLGGEGVRNNGPIITGLVGYNPDGPLHVHDQEACAGYLADAWGGALPETGFRLQYVYPTPMPGGPQAGAILQNSLRRIDEQYIVELVGLPPQVFFPGIYAGQFPLYYSGWIEDVHDPHNWAAPYTIGSYGATLGLPESLRARFADLVATGASTADPAVREPIYFDLQQLYHDTIPAVILFQRPAFRFEPRYLSGFTYREGMDVDNPLYYLISSQ